MYRVDKAAYFETIGYEPHSAAQKSYHESKSRFRIPVCGRRFGKSKMAGVDEETKLIVPRDRQDRYISWIVGPTYDLGEKEFRVIWDDLIIGKGFGHDKRVKRQYNKRSGELYIEFPWNTRVEVRSAQHSETLVGEALDHVIMSEAAKHQPETWERFIRPALSDRRGSADFPTTPEGHNWLYDLWAVGKNPDPSLADYASWNFPSWLNRVIYPGGENDPEILLLKLTMGEEEFLQEIAASFSSFTGKIYGEFDENVHVRPCKYNPLWKNYVFFDWGYTNPLAAIECQVDPWDNVYIWREHYKSYLTLENHIAEMRDREQPDGYKIDMCFGDAADPEATEYVSTHFAPCISMGEAKVNWREGIDLVKSFLKTHQEGYDEFDRPVEVPRLFVDNGCRNMIKEFNTYRRKNTPVVQDSNKAGAAEKVNDHALDALRYGLMHIYKLGATSHLSDVYNLNGMDNTPVFSGVGSAPVESFGGGTGMFVRDKVL